LITGYISIAMIPVIAMMAAIAIPNFVKARDTAMRHVCINNLREIDSAKQQWALENSKDESATPTPEELDKYIKTGFGNLKCPKGGSYRINAVSEKPTCSAEGHESLLQTSQETLQ
jgi:type II secretory pathway pseudopilin PulG